LVATALKGVFALVATAKNGLEGELAAGVAGWGNWFGEFGRL